MVESPPSRSVYADADALSHLKLIKCLDICSQDLTHASRHLDSSFDIFNNISASARAIPQSGTEFSSMIVFEQMFSPSKLICSLLMSFVIRWVWYRRKTYSRSDIDAGSPAAIHSFIKLFASRHAFSRQFLFRLRRGTPGQFSVVFSLPWKYLLATATSALTLISCHTSFHRCLPHWLLYRRALLLQSRFSRRLRRALRDTRPIRQQAAERHTALQVYQSLLLAERRRRKASITLNSRRPVRAVTSRHIDGHSPIQRFRAYRPVHQFSPLSFFKIYISFHILSLKISLYARRLIFRIMMIFFHALFKQYPATRRMSASSITAFK